MLTQEALEAWIIVTQRPGTVRTERTSPTGYTADLRQLQLGAIVGVVFFKSTIDWVVLPPWLWLLMWHYLSEAQVQGHGEE